MLDRAVDAALRGPHNLAGQQDVNSFITAVCQPPAFEDWSDMSPVPLPFPRDQPSDVPSKQSPAPPGIPGLPAPAWPAEGLGLFNQWRTEDILPCCVRLPTSLISH